MIAITDLHPDGVRFENLSPDEVLALLSATAGIVPRDGPETPVPADDPHSPVRAAGRVTWGPNFVWFTEVTPEETNQIGAAFRRLAGAGPMPPP